MTAVEAALQKAAAGEHLSEAEAAAALGEILDGDVEPAFGLDGGGDSTLNFIDLHAPDGTSRRLTSKDLVTGVAKGTLYVQEAGGGGGYGSAHERPAEKVREEVLDGIISPEAAREFYGVAIDPDSGQVLEDETARLRSGGG